jgi:DNA-binding response OmpR family regulator
MPSPNRGARVTVSILVVDDSSTERAIIESKLELAGYRVFSAESGATALRTLYAVRPDLVVLDVLMPEVDGWKTLDLIRQASDVPVIMLTAQTGDIERVRGLRSGADDYLCKPFNPAELTARIEAVLRRTGAGSSSLRDKYDDGVLSLDIGKAEVTVHGEPVRLTPLEFRLLQALTEHAGNVLSTDQLLELAWGDNVTAGHDRVKLYIGYLRKKIDLDPAAPRLIENVRGYGYRYLAPAATRRAAS